MAHVYALAASGDHLLAGGGLGQIAYSQDGGHTWFMGRVGQTQATISCLVTSPSFPADHVALAGTAGDGVLRSTDGGRSWRLVNAGLQDFFLLSLATAPQWGRREIAFAGTARGLYRSPNGGRAWKCWGEALQEFAVLSLAVSPAFSEDGVVLAGTEDHGLFRSADGGRTWQSIHQGLPTEKESLSVNALWLHPSFPSVSTVLAGTADGRLFRSLNGGEGWAQVSSAEAPVLCLGAAGQRLYAGLRGQGLLLSEDDGQSWRLADQLAVQAIHRLAVVGHDLYAYGPLGGLWHSENGGKAWQPLPLEGKNEPPGVLALAGASIHNGLYLLAATSLGVYRRDNAGQRWQRTLPDRETTAVAMSPKFEIDGRAWAGTASGEVFSSSDRGCTWQAIAAPQRISPILTLAVASDGALVAATRNVVEGRTTVWRSNNGGQSWLPWLDEPSTTLSVQFYLARTDALVAIGHRCWHHTVDGWQLVLESDGPILRLWQDSAGSITWALTPGQIQRSQDLTTWENITDSLANHALADLALLDHCDASRVIILGVGGSLWGCGS
jgi:photosystem II stability/assembly factor-like uncharacterized protein